MLLTLNPVLLRVKSSGHSTGYNSKMLRLRIPPQESESVLLMLGKSMPSKSCPRYGSTEEARGKLETTITEQQLRKLVLMSFTGKSNR